MVSTQLPRRHNLVRFGVIMKKIHLRINQLVGITCLSVALVLCSKPSGFIELDVYVSVATRNFIIRPRSMTMVLRPNVQRNTKPESNEIVLKSRGVFVFDEVVDKPSVSCI